MSECVLWEGVTDKGYGYVMVAGRRVYAHRKVWEHAHGPAPRGYHVHHVCEQRLCVNLAHLELVTIGDHNRRHALGGDNHCSSGHEYTPENTYFWRGTKRMCRACNRDRHRQRYANLRRHARRRDREGETSCTDSSCLAPSSPAAAYLAGPVPQ